MIILQSNKNKIFLTLFLTLLTFVGIIATWQKFIVSSQASVNEPVVKNENSDNLDGDSFVKDITNNLDLAKLQWNDLQNELLKTQKQQALYDAAQEYLKNKLSSSTPTSTMISTSTATTSIK